VSQERRGIRAFSPNVFHRVNVLHRGTLDMHPASCEDHSGAGPCGALLQPVEKASADRVDREAGHLEPRSERPGSRDKGESE
jgi:hypothetical protein